MPYGETKVYFDGSHYIAIPHTTRKTRPKRYSVEEEVEVVETKQSNELNTTNCDAETALIEQNDLIETVSDMDAGNTETPLTGTIAKPKTKRKATRKALFEEFYKRSLSMRKRARKSFITDKMRPYFINEERLKDFIEQNLQRKQRNLISRRIRMCRKANLQTFN